MGSGRQNWPSCQVTSKGVDLKRYVTECCVAPPAWSQVMVPSKASEDVHKNSPRAVRIPIYQPIKTGTKGGL